MIALQSSRPFLFDSPCSILFFAFHHIIAHSFKFILHQLPWITHFYKSLLIIALSMPSVHPVSRMTLMPGLQVALPCNCSSFQSFYFSGLTKDTKDIITVIECDDQDGLPNARKPFQKRDNPSTKPGSLVNAIFFLLWIENLPQDVADTTSPSLKKSKRISRFIKDHRQDITCNQVCILNFLYKNLIFLNNF